MVEKRIRALLSIMLCISVFSFNIHSSAETTETIRSEVGGLAGIAVGEKTLIRRLLQEYKFRTATGHGFAAESANNLSDKLRLKRANIVGWNNAKNGPDRKIIGRKGTIWIQDKFYKSASESIEACFDKDGSFRYYKDGKPMQIEVPKDQYAKAVEKMREKIRQGKVKGIKDPAKAEELVRSSRYTYKQVKNITRALKWDSIKYDIKNGVISGVGVFGISTLFSFAVSMMQGDDYSTALKDSVMDGIKTGGVIFASDVIAGQIVKSNVGRSLEKALIPKIETLAKKFGSGFVKSLAKITAKNAESMTTKRAVQTVARMLGNHIVVQAVLFVALSVPTIIDLFKGRISTAEFLKILAVELTTLAGATAGAAGGAAVGGAIAGEIGRGLGAVLGMIAGGFAVNVASEKVASWLYKSDAEEMYDIIQKEFTQLCDDYMINQEEADEITSSLQKKLEEGTLKDMFESENREQFAINMMTPLFEEKLAERNIPKAPTEEDMRKTMMSEMKGIVFVH